MARRQQIIAGVSYKDGAGSGTVTSGRHSSYAAVYISTNSTNAKLVGGMQSLRVTETNGLAFRGQIGNDWLEPVSGMRQWAGTASRFQLRGADFQELIAREYSSLEDVDFRVTPFQLSIAFDYQSATGVSVESATWKWMTVFITEYTVTISDPYTLFMEDVNFIGKGYDRQDNKGAYHTSNDAALWGAGSFIGTTTPSTGSKTKTVGGAVNGVIGASGGVVGSGALSNLGAELVGAIGGLFPY